MYESFAKNIPDSGYFMLMCMLILMGCWCFYDEHIRGKLCCRPIDSSSVYPSNQIINV